MATTSKTTFVPDFEAATERVAQANERALDTGRKLTNAYLDGAEKYATSWAQIERRIGEQSQIEPLAGLLTAHAEMTEEFAKAGVSAARELIAAR
jgi:hypothetical protein